MAIWDSWFGGHDADMPGGPGYIRRRFYDNIRQGFKISKSKSRGPKADMGDFVRNAFANAGALGMVGALSGGWSLPAALVGAKGFINFGQGVSSISSHKRSAELLDHALGGSLSRKYGNLNLSSEGQSTVRTLFAGMGLGGGAINLGQITALVNNDTHRDNVRAILTDALQDRWVNPANGQVEKLEQHEKAELSSLFGLAFLDHWSRNRMHTEAHAVDNGIGTLLQNGSASGKSFYQSLKGNRAREEAFAKNIIEPSGLAQNEKDFLFHILEAQKDADMGAAGSFNKILGGALAMGLAGYADGQLGHGAQQAQIDALRNAVQQHNELFQSIHENLNIRLDTQTGAAMVGNKIHLQGILSRGNIDPQLAAGFLTKGAHTQFGSMDSLSPAQIAAHQGLLVQKIHALAQYSPFVKSVTAHVDWGNAGPLLGELKNQAALAAAGSPVHPGWAAILGLLTGADPKTLPGIQLPPGHEGIVEPYEDPYGTGDTPYETPYTANEEPGVIEPSYEIPKPAEEPVRRTPRRSKTRPTPFERPAPIAGFHPQFGPIFMGQFNYAPFHYNPHIAPGVPHPMILGHAAPVMFPGAFAHASAYAGYGPAMYPGAFAHASAHAGFGPMMFPGAYAHASAYAGHGMPMAPVAAAGAGMFGPMAFGHAAPVAFGPGFHDAHAYASAHAFAGVGYPHAAMPPMYNMFAPQFNFAPQFHWGQMQNHMHEWLGGYAAEWMKKYGPQDKPTGEHPPYGAHEPEAEHPYGHEEPYGHGEPYEHEEGYEHMGPQDAHAYGAPAPQAETATPYQSELPQSLEQPAIRSSRKARKLVGRALDRLVERGHFPAPYALGHEEHGTYESYFSANKQALHGLAGMMAHPSMSGAPYEHLPGAVSRALAESGVYGHAGGERAPIHEYGSAMPYEHAARVMERRTVRLH